MDLSKLSIEQVAYPVVMYLRHKVLWPDKPPAFCKIDGDDEAMHFAAFYEGQLVSVASIFTTDSSAQLRKFATDPNFQGQGVGSRLVQHVIADLKHHGVQRLWCDARESALGFYQQLGFQVVGQRFYKHELPYFKTECFLEAPYSLPVHTNC